MARGHSTLAAALVRDHPREAARLLAQQPRDAATAFLATLTAAQAAAVIGWMGIAAAADLLQRIELDKAVALLGQLRAPEAARLLRAVPVRLRQDHLERMAPTTRAALQLLLYHPPQLVGGLMDPAVKELRPDLTAEVALGELRRQPLGDGHHLYVTDPQHRLLGALRLEDVVRARRGASLEQLMRAPVPTLAPRISLREAAALGAWVEWDALPVTDGDGILIGSLPLADLHRALRATASHDGGGWIGDIGVLFGHLAAVLGDVTRIAVGVPAPKARRNGRA